MTTQKFEQALNEMTPTRTQCSPCSHFTTVVKDSLLDRITEFRFRKEREREREREKKKTFVCEICENSFIIDYIEPQNQIGFEINREKNEGENEKENFKNSVLVEISGEKNLKF